MPPFIRKLTGRIGAVVEGVDFTAPPDLPTITTLRHALNEHKAIVFDHVQLDNAGQERVAGWFGDLTTAHPNVPAADGTTNVLAVDSETSKAKEWHTDVTFVVNPPQLTTLRSIVTTPYGGETLIANAAAAYRDLPEPLRALADSLRVVHTNQYDYARPQATTARRKEYDQVFVSTPYETEHPLVRVHPLTGERGLFIGGFAKRIVGLPSRESADLLRILQSYVTRPENMRSWWSCWAPPAAARAPSSGCSPVSTGPTADGWRSRRSARSSSRPTACCRGSGCCATSPSACTGRTPTSGPSTLEGSQSRSDLIIELAVRERLTVRQIISRLGGGRGHFEFIGTPEQVAYTIITWFESGAADGFNIMAPALPSGLESFIEHVLPILRGKGLFREEYEGTTLREHYGLPVPANQFHPEGTHVSGG